MRKEKTKKKITGLDDEEGIQQTSRRSSTLRNMKPLEVCTCQRAENLKKKSSKIPKKNYPATMVSAARRQIIGGGAPINKSRWRRRPQIVGGGGAAGARLYSKLRSAGQIRPAKVSNPARGALLENRNMGRKQLMTFKIALFSRFNHASQLFQSLNVG